MKNTRLAFAFILIHLCIMTFAQSSKKITGRVVDEKGEAIIGASIIVKGSSIGTSTDVDGNFTINNIRVFYRL